MTARQVLVVIGGPTAVGKSRLALRLAEQAGGEIIVADSLQLIRGLDIGTAKPTPEERARVRHHLLDIVEPREPISAAEYAVKAWAAIRDIWARGRLPLVAGGAGLYIRALLGGPFPGPGADPVVRARLQAEVQAEGPEALHRRLAAADPLTAAAIRPRDRVRLIRALELLDLTGRPPSAFRHGLWGRAVTGPVLFVALDRPRDELYALIDARVEAMLARGLLEEVRRLQAQGFSLADRPLRAIGYRHLLEHLLGHRGLPEAVGRMKHDTRRYAKRQLTWFRKEPGVEWLQVSGWAWIPWLADALDKRVAAIRQGG